MRHPLAQRLRDAAEQHRHADSAALTQRLDFSELVDLHGESSLAVLMMLPAVLSVLPVAGAGTATSVGIGVVAWSWVRVRDTLSLPHRLGQLALNERWSGRCLHGLAGMAYGVSMAHLAWVWITPYADLNHTVG